MKKHFLMYLLAACTLSSVISSCSDDDDTENYPVISGNYEQEDLHLTYSGQPMFGKKVVFVPEGNTATLTLSGSGFAADVTLPENIFPVTIPFKFEELSGVIPGEQTTVLNVADLKYEGDKVTFEGKDEKEGRIIEFKGEATNNLMKLDLNVTMPQNELTGKTIYCYKNEKPNSDYDPLIVDWNVNKSWGMDLDGDGKDDTYDENAMAVFSTIFKLPLINNTTTVADYLYSVFSEVRFLEDGNIQASFKDAPTDAAFKPSPLNVATYQFVEQGKIKLYLNPNAIDKIAQQARAMSEEIDTEALMQGAQQLMTLISGAMKDGINMEYKKNDKGLLEFYLDDATVARPLFEILIPIVNDPLVMQILEKLVKENVPEGLIIFGVAATPEMAWGMVSKFLTDGPEYLKNTNYIKLGMVFSETPAK